MPTPEHLGFSAHGSVEVIQRFLDAYGQHMEFCQLQISSRSLVHDSVITVYYRQPHHAKP